jgi:hypothetical protein
MNALLMTLIAVFALATCSGSCSAKAPQSKAKDETVRVIPNDLYHYAKEEGCSQIATFYKERPEIKGPPYVYGILSSDAAQDFSAALWCERPELGSKKYVLLLKLGSRIWPGGCPSRIEGQDFVGGLSVIQSLNDPLEWYWNMQDQKPVGKPGQTTKGPGIQSLYDGTGNIYYCHEGKWVARPLE